MTRVKKSTDQRHDHHVIIGDEAKYLKFLDDLAKLKRDEKTISAFWKAADKKLAARGIRLQPTIKEMYEEEKRWPEIPSAEAIRYFKLRITPPPGGEGQGHFFLLWDVLTSGGRP